MPDDPIDKETKPALDPLAEANAPTNAEEAEPIVSDNGAKAEDEGEIRRHQQEPIQTRQDHEEMKRTQSQATDFSTLTRTTSRASVPQKSKKWYKQPNPLRWGSIPPVPKEREVSREYHAGWFSRLTFQWMAPLMNVSGSLIYPGAEDELLTRK